VEEREAVERSRSPWPILVIGGLAVFGAISLVQWILGLAFTLGKLLIVAAVVVLGVVYFRGPPDGRR
jgi:hypothetical protein